jgi:uncharacterized repeat protein (TIGR01451 family)
MCHEYGTNQWHLLTPDINGSYANGTWSATAPMPDGSDTSTAGGGCNPCTYAPLYFYSGVLPDGRVVVVGGEYNTNGTTWTNIGFMYDPEIDTWSAQLTVPFAAGCVGDAQGIILEDGRLLLADSICSRNIAEFDPATLTFTALNPTGKADSNNEENWNILPDGTVLTVDSRIASQFEIYDPSTNAWTPGTTPVNLADTGPGVGTSREVGPGVLRPDGTLIYFSGNSLGQNAAYDTATGIWTNAPAMDFPLVSMQTYHYAVADGVASLLPNGNVLVMGSPVINGTPFNTPSHFYEFDGTNLSAVTDSPNAASFKAYHGRMLLLPSGEVLLTAYNQGATQDVMLYSNGGAPQNAWRPVITSAPAVVTPGNTYDISGYLFNGFSEGATYGDDAAMSTNYPLVRITNQATGHVFYARTHDHSRMGVQLVGSTEVVTTEFDVPPGLEAGPSELVVVANGIPSLPIIVNGPDLSISKSHAPALFTQGDVGDTFTLTVSNIGPEPTSGAVTVVDTLPPSLSATAISGPGWTCALGTLTCTRADALAASASYPDITVTVNVANDAPILVTNEAVVSGGGEADNATDNNTVLESVDVRQHTTTTVQSATADYHDEVTLSATVTPAGVSGTVEFFVDGGSVGLGTYDSLTGVATRTYLIPLPSGSYDLRADFTSGEVLYLDSTHTLANGLTVTHEETTVSYTGDTVIPVGGTATMSALLVEDGANDDDGDGGALPISGRSVHFTLGTGATEQSCDAVTDASGVATCPISPVAQPLGPGTVAGAFAGDAYYLPDSDAADTMIFAFLATGSFAVGDLAAAPGATVTFWSSEWPLANPLSTTPTPTSFKGFVNGLSVEPPVCGAPWTTRQGGNSVAPPKAGEIPAYMGVVVPTSVSKRGPVTSGDTAGIVVVQTNPGYAPNPGHPGTGTVVAQYCP